MAESKKYSFTTPSFPRHLRSMFGGLFEEENYSDVTLVCDDKVQFKVHKIVITTWSQVLKEIIDNNPSTNPLIYLRGVQHQEIESILQFMYFGEGSFSQGRMELLWKVVKDLEVKEMIFAKNLDIKEIPTRSEEDDHNTMIEKENNFEDETVNKNEEEDDKNYIETCSILNGKEAFPRIEQDDDDIGKHGSLNMNEESTTSEDDHDNTSGKEELLVEKEVDIELIEAKDEDKNLKIETKEPNNENVYSADRWQVELKAKKRKSGNSDYTCALCGSKFQKKGALVTHVRERHGGLKHSCALCDYKTKRGESLRYHMESQHEGVRHLCPECGLQCRTKNQLDSHIRYQHNSPMYTCSQCGLQFKRPSNLNEHCKSIHEGVKHDCPLCEKKFSHERGMSLHIRSAHQGIKYPCTDCAYQATSKSNLRIHIKTIHEGMRFSCNLCDYQASRDYYVKRHVQSNHAK